jgi:16S rRNA (cytosine1402-N4)-methyltransferase
LQHKPVMLAETLTQLAIKESGFYVDATFGRGGHSQAILNALGNAGRLLAIDRDFDAIDSPVAKSLLADVRFSLRQGCFSTLPVILQELGLMGQIDGILLDLGVSSPQLDDLDRGFSFMHDGPLDMRMNNRNGVSAASWLASVDEKDLAKVLFEYGEERFSRRIAKAIVETRAIKPITTTGQLAAIIGQAQPVREQHKHPATRSFQAIRMEINQELRELEALLSHSLPLLKTGGRLVVISFHSLEDRLVKRFIRNESGAKYDPGRLPVRQSEIQQGLLRKVGKPIKASADELRWNTRARSAVMRVAERV